MHFSHNDDDDDENWNIDERRNLITKRENDLAKRNAKPLNEKEQVPCELLVASASSN